MSVVRIPDITRTSPNVSDVMWATATYENFPQARSLAHQVHRASAEYIVGHDAFTLRSN
jgi:hypothetical protein